MEFLGFGFTYLVGLITGAVLRTWLVTTETKQEIEKALDSTGIRRSEFQQLVKAVEQNRALIEKLNN